MRLFSKVELDHLKYKLINERGLTPDQAQKHIAELIETTKKCHEEAKKKKEKPTLKDSYYQLIMRRHKQ